MTVRWKRVHGKAVRITNPHARAKGGVRQDLGYYVRSTAEANIARLFKYLGVSFEYEPREFNFPVDRGTTHYTPDFKIDLERIEPLLSTGAFVLKPGQSYWVEVKGWFDSKSQTRLARFFKYYPQEASALVLMVNGGRSKAATQVNRRLAEKLGSIPIFHLRELQKAGELLHIPHWEVCK